MKSRWELCFEGPVGNIAKGIALCGAIKKKDICTQVVSASEIHPHPLEVLWVPESIHFLGSPTANKKGNFLEYLT